MTKGGSRFRYDWTPDIWTWRPDSGRWSPEHGRPRRPVYLEVSTEGLAARQAYDFWRESVFYAFEADPYPGEGDAGFQAQVSGLVSEEAEFYNYSSAAVSGRRSRRQIGADGCDDIDLGLVLSGRRAHAFETGDCSVATPGAFYLYDSARPSQVSWEAHRGLHMTLRRTAVEAALGRPLPASPDVAQALSHAPLAPILRAQFALLAQHMHALDSGARGFLLDQTADLALYAIARLDLPGKGEESRRAALFAAARRFIERHYPDPELDADRIAHALGCSRATLYRAFADHGTSVAELIRDLRLAQARRLLERRGEEVLISQVALRCGFLDIPNFNRAFRRHFGITPSEVRQYARESERAGAP